MSDLEIPDDVIKLVCDTYDAALEQVAEQKRANDPGEGDHEEIVAFKAGVPMVVAAELDRLADEWEPKPLPGNVTLAHGSAAEQHREMNWTFAVRLRARARDLRGQA